MYKGLIGPVAAIISDLREKDERSLEQFAHRFINVNLCKLTWEALIIFIFRIANLDKPLKVERNFEEFLIACYKLNNATK